MYPGQKRSGCTPAKGKNVERVVERIRKQLGADWTHFSQEDQDLLKYVIGELWVYKEREFWDMVQYPRITVIAVLDIIAIGRKSLSHEIDTRKTVEEATAILLPHAGKEG
jgi:hypothetical protein